MMERRYHVIVRPESDLVQLRHMQDWHGPGGRAPQSRGGDL